MTVYLTLGFVIYIRIIWTRRGSGKSALTPLGVSEVNAVTLCWNGEMPHWAAKTPTDDVRPRAPFYDAKYRIRSRKPFRIADKVRIIKKRKKIWFIRQVDACELKSRHFARPQMCFRDYNSKIYVWIMNCQLFNWENPFNPSKPCTDWTAETPGANLPEEPKIFRSFRPFCR